MSTTPRTLETELARLRDELAKIYSLVAPHGCDLPNGIWETARAVSDLLDQLRAEVERLRSDRDCEKRLRKDADEFRENAIARAERAEAELHDVSLDLSTANHMIKLERDRADALQTRLNEIESALRKFNLID